RRERSDRGCLSRATCLRDLQARIRPRPRGHSMVRPKRQRAEVRVANRERDTERPMKCALITGITGQDGSFLAELLLQKGYRVCGFARKQSWHKPNCASHLEGRIEILYGDMAEGVDIASAVQEANPDEIYNLASQSRPGESWARAPETLLVNGLGALRL